MEQSIPVHARPSGRTSPLLAALLAVGLGLSACQSLDHPALRSSSPAAPPRGWGIDAVLTDFVPEADRPAYLDLLHDSGIGFLRERGPNAALRSLRAAGYRVVSFLGLRDLRVERAGNQLPEDLRAVYRAAAAMVREYPEVEAWEMVGEPDVGYARDLPDRVAAFQKAVYLGIRSANSPASSRPSSGPLVLMGALALPPGPWLGRAARNGLLDYTDAYNFHFYSHARELTGVINAHRAFITRWRRAEDERPGVARNGARQSSAVRPPSSGLPLWITEAGINAVAPGDFFNPERRKRQAEFTVDTARQALAAPDVAVFMPFILVNGQQDPHALTVAPAARATQGGGQRVEGASEKLSAIGRQPSEVSGPPSALRPQSSVLRLPAWDAYAKFTREHPWPERPLGRPPAAPNPVVVQWLPETETGLPHKVSGTYRFWNYLPLFGELRVYNLGPTPVTGRLHAPALARIRVEGLAEDAAGGSQGPEIEIAPLGMVSYRVTLSALTTQYLREDWEPAFIERSGRRSSAFFGLEQWPRARSFAAEPLALRPLRGGRPRFPEFASYRLGEQAGPWSTMNGLRVQSVPWAGADGTARFWTDRVEQDPLEPPMASARLDGLPPAGFIRLQLSRPMDARAAVRVDLLDEDGQRFTIWENFGRSYFLQSPEVWLNLRDFGVYFWGRTREDPGFHPERVREIQLRFYFTQPNDPLDLNLDFMRIR